MTDNPETHVFDTTAGVPLTITTDAKPTQLSFVLVEHGDVMTCHRIRDVGYIGSKRLTMEDGDIYMVRLNYWQGPDYLSLDFGMTTREDALRFINLFHNATH